MDAISVYSELRLDFPRKRLVYFILFVYYLQQKIKRFYLLQQYSLL